MTLIHVSMLVNFVTNSTLLYVVILQDVLCSYGLAGELTKHYIIRPTDQTIQELNLKPQNLILLTVNRQTLSSMNKSRTSQV